jgi:hypothetical protein
MRQHQLKQEIANLDKAIERRKAEIVDLCIKKEYLSALAEGIGKGAARLIADTYTKGIKVEITASKAEPLKLKKTLDALTQHFGHEKGCDCTDCMKETARKMYSELTIEGKITHEGYGKILDDAQPKHKGKEIGEYKVPVKVPITTSHPLPDGVEIVEDDTNAK